jgi:hypothetical protein
MSSESKRALDAVIHMFLKTGGDLVANSVERDGVTTFRMKLSHSEPYKKALRAYVKAHNAKHKGGVSVSFPEPFVLRLRASRKTSKGK